MYTLKTVQVTENWSLDCYTYTSMFGEKSYRIDVIMECVPWRDVVHSYTNIGSAEEANGIFKDLYKRYKEL